MSKQLHYFPTVTREPFETQGRITDHIESGELSRRFGLPDLNPQTDRIMICGSPAMLASLREAAEQRGFKEGNTTTPGEYVIERAFVSQ